MDPTGDDLLYLSLFAVVFETSKNKRKKRKQWCKKWLQRRNKFTHVNLLNELRDEPTDYRNYLRMTESVYNELLSLVSTFIKKKDTQMRAAISPHEKLAATLRFLATGQSYESLKYSTRISPQSLGQIIPDTCVALYKVLQKYIKFPNSVEKWKEISKDFENRCNFPHCIGAMDGKHIDIVPPRNSGSYYFNYKGKHSMVLLAIVDANYRFLLVDFGTNGRVSDGGVLQNTRFYEKLLQKSLRIPQPDNITENLKNIPFVFVADDAFPLTTEIMKPFRQSCLDSAKKEVFNYRISRARHIIENVFGILASRFRIFHTAINLEPQNVEKVVMAACALHNFLMAQQPTAYAPANCFYQESAQDGSILSLGCDSTQSNMNPLESRNRGNICKNAKEVREQFMDYFMTEGKVSWQNKHILRNKQNI